jgi:hypothetical protein
MENYTNDRFFSESYPHAYNVEPFYICSNSLYNDIIIKKKISYIFDNHL